jgi:hypothetical protein
VHIAGSDQARGDARDLLGIPVAPGMDDTCHAQRGEFAEPGRTSLVVVDRQRLQEHDFGGRLAGRGHASRRLAMPASSTWACAPVGIQPAPKRTARPMACGSQRLLRLKPRSVQLVAVLTRAG